MRRGIVGDGERGGAGDECGFEGRLQLCFREVHAEAEVRSVAHCDMASRAPWTELLRVLEGARVLVGGPERDDHRFSPLDELLADRDILRGNSRERAANAQGHQPEQLVDHGRDQFGVVPYPRHEIGLPEQQVDEVGELVGGGLEARDEDGCREPDEVDAAAEHPASESYLAAMARIYAACARMLTPGGYLVVVTKNLRSHGRLRNLAGDTVALCQHAGLDYWQHVIALLVGIRDSELRARPSLWQLLHTRNALQNGERTQLVCHEDVLVFRREPNSRSSGKPKARRRRAHQPKQSTKTR